MKKYVVFLLLIGVFSFSGCNNDDDGDRADPIVGDWILTDVTPAVIDINCPNDTTVSINGDSTVQSSFYLQENNCNLQQETGSWTYNGGSSYTIEFPELGDVQGTTSFTETDTFTFTTEGAVLTFERLL